MDDEDVPVIPESIGLELDDESGIEDILAFVDAPATDGSVVDLDSASLSLEAELEPLEAELEPLDLEELSPEAELEPAVLEAPAVEPALIEAESPDPGSLVYVDETGAAYEFREAQAGERDGAELLDEVEFDLFLSSLDLSPLTGWSDEAGFSAPRSELALHDLQIGPEEADDSAVQDGEIPMLSDEDRERMEELPGAEAHEGEPPEEAIPLSPAFAAYVSLESLSPRFRIRADGELEPVDGAGRGEEAFAELMELNESEDAGEGEELIILRDGVFQIDSGARRASRSDPALKALADAVLRGRRR